MANKYIPFCKIKNINSIKRNHERRKKRKKKLNENETKRMKQKVEIIFKNFDSSFETVIKNFKNESQQKQTKLKATKKSNKKENKIKKIPLNALIFVINLFSTFFHNVKNENAQFSRHLIFTEKIVFAATIKRFYFF